MFNSVLFVPAVSRTEWISKLLPGWSASSLKLAGRRFLDYGLQHASKLDAELVEILDWQYSPELAKDYDELSRQTFPLFYCKATGPLPRGLKELEGLSSPLTHHIHDGLVVFWGLCLPGHVPGDAKLTPISREECEDTPLGAYKFMDGKWMRMRPCGVTMRNVKAWHMANLAVQRNGDMFTLPGYSAEDGIRIGRNVVMEHGTQVKPPVIMNDNSWCERNVTLDGFVSIGSGAVIGEGTRLRRTAVDTDTYVGKGLDLENKIVVGKRIIDAETGAWMDMDDEPGIARRIGGFSWFAAVWDFLRGRSHQSQRRDNG